MKKVLFMLINMNIGGTEKALLNMLEEMPQEEYEVTLLLLEEYGGFLSEIPKYVKVQYLENFNHINQLLNQPTQKIGLELIKQRQYIQGIKLIWIYFLTKFMGEKSLLFKSVLSDYPTLEEQYDVAVAYAGPMDFITYFIDHKVKASLKVQWIHFDITKIGFNKKFAKKYYKKFDRVFVVSNQGREKLIQLVPSIAARTETFLNRVSAKHVEEQGAMGKGFHDDF
ncbi:MAG: glycosyltransferase, partial [Peptostreptococcaceae bacterium]